MKDFKAIPPSVLQVLGEQWKPADAQSVFERILNEYPDRRSDPSFYHIHTGQEIESDFDEYTHAEVVQLVDEGAFGALAISRPKAVSINEHAKHALSEFCREVYAAWEKYKSRIAEIERFGVFPRE